MDIESIVVSISQLPHQQRHLLLRRLRVSGLLDDDELMTDQNRLAIAPALGSRQNRAQSHRVQRHKADALPGLPEPPSPEPPSTAFGKAAHFVAPEAAPSPKDLRPPAAVDSTPHSETNIAHESTGAVDEEYRSPISGRVVVGSPKDGTGMDEDPHLMPPLPGQAPEQPIGIIFDGGSKGNPGRGYGSYAVDWPGFPQQIVKLQFGNHVTNNEAEYDTLIAALEAMIQRLRDQGADPSTASIEMRGDSQLVVYQVLGQWKCKDARMKLRRDRVRELLESFSTWRINHHDRSNSVRVLGH